MKRADRAAWRSATTMADLGELVVAWLNGQLQQTPGHSGPPYVETIPLIPALTLANRAGFVTDNSQAAGGHEGRAWEAWVTWFATGDTLARLRAAVAGTPLILTACREHEHGAHYWSPCPRREVLGFWPIAAATPAASWQTPGTSPSSIPRPAGTTGCGQPWRDSPLEVRSEPLP